MAVDEKTKFEDALERLEQLVAEMETGKLPLEAGMKRFEEGVKLTEFCARKLSEAEKKVEILLQTADGALAWGPLASSAADDETESDSG